MLNTVTHLTAYSTLPFSPTFTNPFGEAIPNNYYNLPVIAGATYASFNSEIADLDGDGKPDLVANAGSATLSVLRNQATTGSIAPHPLHPGSALPPVLTHVHLP